jgi:hypothetical protein
MTLGRMVLSMVGVVGPASVRLAVYRSMDRLWLTGLMGLPLRPAFG